MPPSRWSRWGRRPPHACHTASDRGGGGGRARRAQSGGDRGRRRRALVGEPAGAGPGELVSGAPYPQLLAEPEPTTKLTPAGQLTLTFSDPLQTCSAPPARGSLRPTPGHWRLLDAHTLAFVPERARLWARQRRAPRAAASRPPCRTGRATLTRSLHWQVPQGSTLRLQQLLAELGYLPVALAASARPGAALARASSSPRRSRRPRDGLSGATRTRRVSCARCGAPGSRTRSRAAP